MLAFCVTASAQWNGSWNTGWGTGWSGGDAGYVNPRYVLLDASLDSSTVTLGPELITNGNFSAWSGDNPTGFTLAFTEDDTNYVTQVGSAARFVSTGIIGFYQSQTARTKRSILVGIRVDSLATGSFYVSPNGGSDAALTVTTIGQKYGVWYGIPTTSAWVVAQGSLNAVFTNLSLRDYWFADASSAARHLSPANLMTWNTLTSGLKVLNFNGTTDLIDTGSDYYSTGAITLVRWIRPETAGEGSAGRIVSNGKLIVALDNTGGRISVTSDGGTTTVYSATGAWTANTWSHLVVCIGADGKATVCINGALSGTAQQASGTRAAGTGNVFFGNAADASKTFDGDIYGAIDIKGTPNDIIGFAYARYMATKDLYQ
jgi:hypothetical protein